MMKRMRDVRGMTLLEMVVVIFILSAIAMGAVAFTGNADDQFRYEETRTRLGEIRRAIVGERDAVYAGSARLSGFVVENGLLPADIQGLYIKPTGYDDFGAQSPLFDPVPAANGINNGDEVTLGAANEILLKGYLPALRLPTGGGGYFDGWGNRGPAPNDGWSVAADSAHFQSTSLGADGAAGGSDYAQDMPDDVVQEDWTQTLAGWTVTLTNRSGADITTPSALRVSLLVYVNDADAVNPFNWWRITSDPIPGGTFSDGASVTATFPTSGTRVPIGEHLLVAVNDPDGASHTSDDTPFLNADGTRVTGHAAFFPGTTRPVVELTIR
jgi:prepilin-type N-terminal cleavage/methylation domain-containing protein